MNWKRFGAFCVVFLLLALSGQGLAQDSKSVKIIIGGKYMSDGGTWFIPMNRSYNKVALFSEYREGIGIRNRSAGPVTVQNITLVRDSGVMPEEFTLQKYGKYKALDFRPTVIPAKKGFDFSVRFYPVESPQRGAKVTIEFGDGSKFNFRVKGKGRPKANFFKK